MTSKKYLDQKKHLRVFEDRSEYHSSSGAIATYTEGPMSERARKRLKQIKDELEDGFLDRLIYDLKTGKATANSHKVSATTQSSLKNLTSQVTSEVGRALVGLSVMQLAIKSISEEQSIRLHKASTSRSSFSWTEGVSMRTLDKSYVTPVLRKHDLVRLNADGFMMTRSLAENYPYSDLYKAQLRGAREDWLQLVENLENGSTSPIESLKFFLTLLINSASEFTKLSDELLRKIKEKKSSINNRKDVIKILSLHQEESDYAARLLEIGMHALMQAVIETGSLGPVELKPLSQMRSANKKHGNIGDIEIIEQGEIICSWDAKYGKSYLREELEEAAEKIKNHDRVEVVGFVTNAAVQRPKEIEKRIHELSTHYGVQFMILDFFEWVDMTYKKCLDENFIDETTLSREWISAYSLTLCQRKPDIAPIDEPCFEWVRLLREQLL